MNKFWPSLHINAYKALSRGFEPTRANLKLASPEIGFVRNCLRRHDLRQIWVFVGHGPSSWSSSDMGLRHGKAFVNHGASSFLGLCHPRVFVTHVSSSFKGLRHPRATSAMGFLGLISYGLRHIHNYGLHQQNSWTWAYRQLNSINHEGAICILGFGCRLKLWAASVIRLRKPTLVTRQSASVIFNRKGTSTKGWAPFGPQFLVFSCIK